MSNTESELLGSIPSASLSGAIMTASYLASAPVAVALNPEPLHFGRGGLRQSVDRRKHFRSCLHASFDSLLKRIVRPQDPRNLPVSFRVLHHLRHALEPKTLVGERVRHIELDRRIVPQVLDRARRGEIGKHELIVAQHSNRALRRQVRLAVGSNSRRVTEL